MAYDLPGRLRLLRQRLHPDPNDPPRRWLRRRWPWFLGLALAIVGVGALDVWLATCGFMGCPSSRQIRTFKSAEGGRIVDRNAKFMGRLAPVARVNVPLEDVPSHVREAFIATEDRRFYEHQGVDYRGFVRAIVRNVAAMGVREGFSTITMQATRNTFLANRYSGRSLRRKLIELRLTRLVERELTKDQILELYLNAIYLGSGTYGVEAASRDIFGKSVKELNIAEGALLAGLPKAPSNYNPRANEKAARNRRNVVLGLMAEQGYISALTAGQAQKQRIRIAKEEWRPNAPDEMLSLEVIRAFVDSVLPDVLKEGEVVVYTTIDSLAQRAADRAISRHAAAISRSVQGALVALDPRTGDIRAVVPGRRTDVQRGFNRAFRAKRQPGSAFKPFVYAAAIQNGIAPSAMVDDVPIEVDMAGRVWRPANYDESYQGRVTLHKALMHSSNAATVRVSRAIGERNVVLAAQRQGIRSPLAPVPAIALGAVEVTPLELVAAYAAFANGGVRVTPRLVQRIEAPDGTVLWSSEVDTGEQVLDARDAYEVTTMLRGVVDHGTGRGIRGAGITAPVAGKTGTTNNGADVWFVGYTPTLVAGIWFGYDDPRPISGNASGGRYAVPAWADFYRAGWREPRNSAWLPPDNMVMRVVDPTTGLLATEWCPAQVREWYKPSDAPHEACQEHFAPPEESIWGDWGFEQQEEPDTQGGRRDEPWTRDVQREVGRALRRILKF